ncbi:NAD-reducing hydrogenase HoxS subunit delta [Tautonia plasticadhaerens]|uniref:NAD-reducing hydrogenase HoxS subunit delta n=1 Tax=Tautonia plasticadhaerens TaxID=2527974 RepID=A0A518H3H5_9BACT|nr:oxidoreductase [Tautonia plasticadhaerens]QDV35383.1 NAD-reducing hydrogenase HoxS subunit delta [Tautonia plasticadhaerens]
MGRLRLATAWLGGCSGCHMSFLDMDEFLLDLADLADLVFSPPLVDTKVYPEGVDLVLVEGAVCNAEHLALIRTIRRRTRLVVALGDCAVTGNVSAIRNVLGGASAVLGRSYLENCDPPGPIPSDPDLVPTLLDRVVPVHAVVDVDLFLPGCPPSGPTIRAVLEKVIAGEPVDPGTLGLHFGGYGRRSLELDGGPTRPEWPSRDRPTRKGRDDGRANPDRPGDPDRGPRQDQHPPER